MTSGLVELAAEEGATRCHVLVFPRARRPVVLVSELPDNDGLSVARNFERIVGHVEQHASVPLSGGLVAGTLAGAVLGGACVARRGDRRPAPSVARWRILAASAAHCLCRGPDPVPGLAVDVKASDRLVHAYAVGLRVAG
jgi:hypothetical protein